MATSPAERSSTAPHADAIRELQSEMVERFREGREMNERTDKLAESMLDLANLVVKLAASVEGIETALALIFNMDVETEDDHAG